MAENYLFTPDSDTTLYLKYHEEDEDLEIAFKTRTVYHYLKVPLKVWKKNYKEVSSGGSSGKFFNEYIKEKYEFTRTA